MAYSDRYKENSLLTSSLNGLTVQTLRTTGFNLSDFAGKKYYPIALLFDGSFIAKWFEYKLEHPDDEWTTVFAALESSYKPDGVRPLSAFKEDLTPADQESLAKFIGNNQAYFGVMAPAWIDSPAWLLSLISIYKKSHTDKNFWYFPLQASKLWYKGFAGTNLAAQLSENTPTQLYATLFRKADSDLPELLDLLHKDDPEKVPFTQYSQWPAPVSGEVARTYQGIRASSYIPGVTKNLIVNPPEGMQPLRVNPVKATDNYLIPAGNNSMVFRLNQMLPSGYTPEPGIYTFSFYAKYDGEVIGQPSNRFPLAVSFNWNGTTKSYKLYNSWKRYYISGPLTADSDLNNYYVSVSALDSSKLFPPIRVAGLLLEKSPYPSAYNPAWHTIGSTYTGPKQFMPVLYQLPLVSNASANNYYATLKFTEGTIIYKKYIEDHGFSEHWDSLGFSDSSYLNWGFNSSGHPELNISLPGIPPVTADISLAGHEDNWTLNVLRFKADKAQWTVYAVHDVSQPLIDLSLTAGSILPSVPQTCSTSAYITPNNPASEYAVRYNLALGSRLHKGDDPDDPSDPYNQFFSDQETEIEPPDNSGYEDLVYCNWLLTDDEIKQLAVNTLVLKVQGDDHNQELSVISGSINQSDFGRAYIAGVK